MSEKRSRISLFLAPLVIAVLAIGFAPSLAGLFTQPFLRASSIPGPSDLSVYIANDRIYVAWLAITTFLVVAIASWFLSRWEGLGGTILITHLRQAAVLYAYLGLNVAVDLYDRLFGNIWMCYVCPPPWGVVVSAALIANLAVQLPLRKRAA